MGFLSGLENSKSLDNTRCSSESGSDEAEKGRQAGIAATVWEPTARIRMQVGVWLLCF